MGVTIYNPGGNVGSNGSDVSVNSSSSLNHSDFKSSSKPPLQSRCFTFHGRGQPGHIRPNCPNRYVKWVMFPSQFCTALQNKMKALISGDINSIPCTKLLIHSGCEITCVSSSLVTPKCYTVKFGCSLIVVQIRANMYPLAKT